MNDLQYLEKYGYTKADLVEMLEGAIGSHEMLAISILSDAQEYLARGFNDMARHAINRAKWVISQTIKAKLAA